MANAGAGILGVMARDTVLFAADTAFGQYEVIDTVYGGRPARVLYSGHRQAAQSGVARDGGAELLFDYNERFMELVRRLRPSRLLLLGGGAFTLPHALMHEFPALVIDVIELDPELPAIAQKYFDFVPSERVHVHIGGGAEYLAQTAQVYDMVLLDVFVSAAVPPVFQSADTAHNLARCLRRSGVVAMNIIASYYGERAAVLRRQIAAFSAAFADIQLYPAGHEPSLWLPQNFILVAQHGPRDLAPFLRYDRLDLPEG